jgi:flavin-dependent dehydrogenase
VSEKRLQAYEKAWRERFGKMHEALYRIRAIVGRMEQEKLDGLVRTAASLPLEKMSLGQIVFELLKSQPSLLLEARTLISTGLIMK